MIQSSFLFLLILILKINKFTKHLKIAKCMYLIEFRTNEIESYILSIRKKIKTAIVFNQDSKCNCNLNLLQNIQQLHQK